jgi:hypothetical protein
MRKGDLTMAMYKTKKDAAYAWVQEFNAIPQSVIEKLNKLNMYENGEEMTEITPPTINDRVSIWDGDYNGEGEVVGYSKNDDGEMIYTIVPDEDTSVKIHLGTDEFEVIRDDFLPMWGTMWQFSDGCDQWWLQKHLQDMADCGFRIYEQEDFEYVFGIDGCGYDFYESHWIPLYEKRGFHWDDETVKEMEEND